MQHHDIYLTLMHPSTPTSTESEPKIDYKKKTEPLELLLKSVKILRKSTKLQSFQKENNLTEITHKTKTKVAKY